jgi:hypothetical protein
MAMAAINQVRREVPLAVPTGPLTAAHRAQLAQAQEHSKPIRKTARVAAFNGWVTAGIAVLSAPFALFSISGFLILVGLSIVAYNEFRGRKKLLEFEPAAATLLGWNQLGLLAMIIVYCVWMLVTSLNGGSELVAQMKGYADLDEALGGPGATNALYRLIAISLYGGVIALSIVFQGLNALYYFTRRKHVEAYVQQTPEWIRELQRTT